MSNLGHLYRNNKVILTFTALFKQDSFRCLLVKNIIVTFTCYYAKSCNLDEAVVRFNRLKFARAKQICFFRMLDKIFIVLAKVPRLNACETILI